MPCTFQKIFYHGILLNLTGMPVQNPYRKNIAASVFIFDTVSNVFYLVSKIEIEIMVILFIIIYVIDLLSLRNSTTPRKINQLVDFHMLPMNIHSVIAIMVDTMLKASTNKSRINIAIGAHKIAIIEFSIFNSIYNHRFSFPGESDSGFGLGTVLPI